MTHSYHEGQPGYSAAQILYDDCLECAQRSERDNRGIAALDPFRFADAWKRAADWNRAGVSDISVAEMPLLSALWAVQLQLEKAGWPIGELPRPHTLDAITKILAEGGPQ